MRRIIFIVLLTIVSIVIILSTFSGFKDKSKEDIKKELNTFLSVSNELYYYDKVKQTFIKGNSDSADYLYYAINPIDGIYYKRSENKDPLKIQVTDSWIKINVSTWQYIFVLNDVFQKYEVNCNGFKIAQLGKWTFFLNNDINDFKLYSFNTILDVWMIQNDKSITHFKLFPSLLFKHNFLYTDLLKWADVLRISMVDSMFYVDLKNPQAQHTLVWVKEWEENLVWITKADISSKLEKYKKMYDFVLKIKFDEMPWYSLMVNYQTFFDNQYKKEIYYKWIIIKNFLELINNPKNQSENYASISSAIDELARISDKKKDEWISLLKSYYYLAYYSNILLSDNSNNINNDSINAGRIIKQALNNKKISEDYFSTLSDVYFNYNFSWKQKSELDGYLNNYLADIKKRKLLKDEDFLPFSFFLTQYSLSHTEISQDSVSIIIYLIEMFDNYYSTIEDDWKWFNALWVQFYNFSKIITNVNNGIFKKYFQNTTDWVVLKPEYIKTNNVTVESTNLWENTIEFLSSLHRTWFNDLQNKKPFFDKNLNSFYNKNVLITNYSELAKKYKMLEVIIETLEDYNKYLDSLKLNSDTKKIRALVFDDTFSLSEQDLISYIVKFNWIEDINNIKLLNQSTMNRDKYYEVEVYISWNKFTFKLNPIWHIISNVMIYYPNWTVNSMFNTQAINLDEKQQIFQDRFIVEKDYNKKAKYNFADFFNIVFLSGSQNIWDDGYSYSEWDVNNNEPKTKEESKFISVFKQDNLLDWDFKIISKTLPIPFSNISVSIVNWEYQIKINSVRKTFSYMSEPSTIDFDSDYDFVKKYFYNVKFRVFNTNTDSYDYNGNYIKIFPANIITQDFPNKIKNLWQYLYTLRRIYPQWQWNIEFDLNLWKVFINSEGHDLLK